MMAAPGITLDQWIETPQAKDQKKVRKVVRGIRKALYCLWTAGFIHGDMHLRNVMVNPKSQGIKIIDFGMSRGVNKRSPKYRGPSNLGELRPVFKEWFWHQFKKVLKTHGFNKGNPDLVMFENACKDNNVFCKVTTDALKILR
jgi:serine/threonine protein kinase